jgi:hypothetical protein
MSGADPRVTPMRPDLAAQDRASKAFEATLPAVALRRSPDAGSEQMDQLLFGEHFAVLDEADGWVWGQARRDGYVGYVAAADLAPRLGMPTHRVSALRSYAYAAPDIRAPALGLYSMNALARVEAASLEEGQGRFAQVAGAGWMALAHLSPIGVFETDPAAVAERFLGAPYLWGGRESLGLDCSGLTQAALLACGLACPRDADMQLAVGRTVDGADLRRGDLVIWPDHVGMMLDEERLIHANGFHMAVAIEPLAVKLARRDRMGSAPPIGYRRP